MRVAASGTTARSSHRPAHVDFPAALGQQPAAAAAAPPPPPIGVVPQARSPPTQSDTLPQPLAFSSPSRRFAHPFGREDTSQAEYAGSIPVIGSTSTWVYRTGS